MEVRLLGPLEAWADGEPLVLGGPKQRLVLAALALRLDQVVSVDELVDAGWGEALPANPTNALQHQVAQLRKVIEPDPANPRHLLTSGPGYRLDGATVRCDANDVESALAEAADAAAVGDATRASQLVDGALARWRGRALADFRYDEFASGAAERLDAAHLSANELRIDLAMDAGDHERVLPVLAELTTDHPLVESLWVRRVDALTRVGRPSDALRVIDEARRHLIDVGLDLGPPLRQRQQAILDPDQTPQAEPPARPARTIGNLPEPPNRLIGRDRDVVRVNDLLDRHRLVTLTGPGGAGKTRLAQAAASARTDRHPGGVWFVALDRLDDPSLLVAEIGRVTAMKERPDRPVLDTLVDHLDGDTLLVLDNGEHVVEALADLVDQLIARCPDLSVLVTSQVVLATPGEVIFEVAPLATPGHTASIYDPIAEVDAVALFVERARQVGAPVSRWGDDDLAAVANITSALDGLPLAIELAAARSRSMSLGEIARGLDDRFGLLTGGARTAPNRQRSLAEAVAWSLDLLGQDHRDLLTELSVLVGPFDAADVAAVTGRSPATVRDDLAALVDRSLVTRTDDVAGSARFALLESIRHHGRSTIDQASLDNLRHRLLDHMVEVATEADIGIRGRDQLGSLDRLDAASDNIRSALAWSLEGGSLRHGVQLAAALGRYWDWRGLLAEGGLWTGRLADQDPEPQPGLASMLAWRAYMAWESRELERAISHHDQAMAAATVLNDPAELAAVLSISVLIARTEGAHDRAREKADELLAAAEAAGEPWLEAWTSSALATVAVADGRLDDGEALARSAIERFAAIGDQRGRGWGQLTLAEASIERGDHASAQTEALAALRSAAVLDDDRSVLWAMEILTEAALGQGRPDDAARWWGAASPLRDARGLIGSAGEIGQQRRIQERLRQTLGDRFDPLTDQGRRDRTTIIETALDPSLHPTTDRTSADSAVRDVGRG
ncbi:MAG: BTAD domain-containing putative transcriptional regulator [Actinomycetota bacterium]